MAMTISIAQVSPSVLARVPANFTVTVTNTSSSAVTLSALQVVEITESDAQVQQPLYLTPNVPVGVGNPIIGASASVTYGFQVVFTNPMMVGPSPQNAPGGAAPTNSAFVSDPFFTLQAQGQLSDGSVGFSPPLLVAILAPGVNFAPPQGGALWLSQGANLINFLTL